MLKQIYTWKIGCSQCSRSEVYNVEQPDQAFVSPQYNLPEGWARIEDPRPQAEPGSRARRSTTGLSYFSTQDMFYIPTYREYCPTCYPLVIKAAEEQKARDEHADKYL